MDGEALRRQRRAGVSAAAVTKERLEAWTLPVHAKSETEKTRIYRVIESLKILFGHLDPKGKANVVSAMFQVTLRKGSIVISQGDEGDNFYVIDRGTVNFLVAREGKEPLCVGQGGPGTAFGELALLYNAPRAATVVAASDVVLWALDRETFQMMLTTAENTKKRTYEDFLENVGIFGIFTRSHDCWSRPDFSLYSSNSTAEASGLNKYERVQLCDLLKQRDFRPGECIVRQGEEGDDFYILESGEATCVVEDETGVEVPVCEYKAGGYFGELALMTGGVRRASVFAVTKCSCVSVDSTTFNRVLGPVKHAFSKKIPSYERAVEEKTKEMASKLSPRLSR